MPSKNVMFISNINNKDDWGLKMEKWSSFTIPKIKAYCKKYNIDLVILGNKHLDKMKMPPIFENRFHWHKSVLICIYAIKYFASSKKFNKYDKMCFMDIDIDIVRDDENIFDSVKEDVLYGMIEYDSYMISTLEMHLKLYFDTEYDKSMTLINTGVFIMKKEIAHNIAKYLPTNKGWSTFLDKNTDFGKVLYDADILTYAMHLSKTKVINIDEKWNCYYKGKTKKDFFIHYMGDEGKDFLLKIANNEKIPEWEWSNDENKWVEKEINYIPIGTDCFSAKYLEACNKRINAFPFDWLGMYEIGMNYVNYNIQNKFEFFTKELDKDERGVFSKKYPTVFFPHHDLIKDSHLIEVFKRREERFMKAITDENSRCLFLYKLSWYHYDDISHYKEIIKECEILKKNVSCSHKIIIFIVYPNKDDIDIDLTKYSHISVPDYVKLQKIRITDLSYSEIDDIEKEEFEKCLKSNEKELLMLKNA